MKNPPALDVYVDTGNNSVNLYDHLNNQPVAVMTGPHSERLDMALFLKECVDFYWEQKRKQ